MVLESCVDQHYPYCITCTSHNASMQLHVVMCFDIFGDTFLFRFPVCKQGKDDKEQANS